MNQKLLIGLTVATMSFANISHADFTFYSDTNNCSNVPGDWAGQGKASHWLIGDCKYTGKAQVSPVDDSGRFTLTVDARKQSGTPLCPDHHVTTLNAVCANGKVTVKTQYGDMGGNFSTNSGNAGGELTVSPGIKVKVDIQFNRSN